jgi:hypothetical protein
MTRLIHSLPTTHCHEPKAESIPSFVLLIELVTRSEDERCFSRETGEVPGTLASEPLPRHLALRTGSEVADDDDVARTGFEPVWVL